MLGSPFLWNEGFLLPYISIRSWMPRLVSKWFCSSEWSNRAHWYSSQWARCLTAFNFVEKVVVKILGSWQKTPSLTINCHNFLDNFPAKISTQKLMAGPAKGIVLNILPVKAKGTQDTWRQCVKVKLVATGKTVLAFVPGDGHISWISENDEVFVMPTRKKDIPQVKYKVEKVASCSFHRLDKSW